MQLEDGYLNASKHNIKPNKSVIIVDKSFGSKGLLIMLICFVINIVL